MKKLIVLNISLLIVQFCFSQTNYPKSLNLDGDTVVVITQDQLSKVNSIIVERDFLQQELILCDSVILLKDKLIETQNSRISNFNIMVLNYEEQLKNQKLILEKQNLLWEQQRKQFRKQKLVIGGVCVGVGIIAGIIISK